MNRKEMIREYKQRKPVMGVYRVACSATGTTLVAASTDVPSILNRHRAGLSMGGHSSRILQADWKAHGPDAFVFETLDILTPPDTPDYNPLADLTTLEDLWLEKLGVPADRLHTINPKRLPPVVRS